MMSGWAESQSRSRNSIWGRREASSGSGPASPSLPAAVRWRWASPPPLGGVSSWSLERCRDHHLSHTPSAGSPAAPGSAWARLHHAALTLFRSGLPAHWDLAAPCSAPSYHTQTPPETNTSPLAVTRSLYNGTTRPLPL